MIRCALLALAVALGAGLPPLTPVGAQGMDPLEARVLAPLAPKLRWDNVEGAPYWQDGVAPEGWLHRAGEDGRLHAVLLQPGDRVRLVLPGRAMLRLRRLDAPLDPGALRVLRSAGDGLAVEADLVPHGAGDLVALTQGAAPTAFTVARPADAEGSAQLALFVSRLETPPMPEIHRRRIDLPVPDSRLTRPETPLGIAYDPLDADKPASVTLEGPLRLAIESRMVLDDRPDWHRAYGLELHLDGASWRRFALEAGPDLRDAPRVAGAPEIALASPRRVIATLPEGRHELAISVGAAAHLRITAYEGEAFLLPGLNAPHGLGDGWPDTAALPGAGLPDGFDRARLDALLAAPEGVAGAAELAQAVARDNRFDGGLLGATIADRAAAAAPSLAGLDALGDRLRGARSFHRDLVPDGPMTAAPGRAWTIPAQLRDPRDPSRPETPGPIPRAALLGQLVDGLFVPLDGPARRYTVPPRPAPTTLRLLVAHKGEGPRQLSVRVGDGPARQVIVGAAPALPPEAFEPSAGAIGLERLGPQPGPDGTRSGLFAQHAQPGPMLAAGIVALPLPPEAEIVTISAPGDAGPPLRVALQYRAAKPWTLGDGLYEAAVAHFGHDRAAAAFAQAVRAAIACEGAPASCAAPDAWTDPAGAELRNDWLPLLRLLRARHDTVFAAAADGVPPRPSRAPSISAEAARRLLDRADRLMAHRDPVAALELYARVERNSAGAAWQRAVLGQARALAAAGEGHLARRLLAALALQRARPGLAERALSRLAEEARASEDAAALIGLAAQSLAVADGPPPAGALAALATHLAAEGRDAMALQAGLLLPPAPHGPELSRTLAQAAYRAPWPRSFERLLDGLDAEQAALWPGLAAQRSGDTERALTLFQAAAAAGEPWRQALAEGARLAERLETGSDPQAAADWLAWQARHPGPRIPEDAFEAFTAHAGALTLVSRVRNLPFRAVTAEPGRPAELTVAGPATLTLEIRPLHAGPRSRVDGWVAVEAAGERIDLPVTANGVSPGLDIAGDPRRPGTTVRETLSLPPGRHEVRIRPAGFDIAVRAEIARPALPLSPLPPPTPETAAQAQVPAEGLAADGETAALRRLAALLRDLEARPREGAALAEAARLAKALETTPRGRRLGDRLAGITRWERLRTVASSAGFRSLPVAAWAPESPALRVRTALLGDLGPREELLFGESTLALALLEPAPTVLRARVALATPPTYAPPAVTLRYRLDEGPWLRLALDPAQPEATLEIPVPAGDHALRFALESPPPNAFVRLDLSERGRANGGSALEQPERTWDVATREEPVVLLLEGPAWLRIDSETGGAATSSYRPVAAGWQEVVIRPESDADERLVRVFRLVPNDTARMPPPLPPRQVPAAPAPPFVLSETGPPSVLTLADKLPPGGHEDGTWSVSLGAERRLPPEESGPGGEADRFAQLSAVHRFRHPSHDLRLRTEALGRLRSHQGPTLGLVERIDYGLPDSPLRFAGALGFHAQDLRGGGVEWSLDGRASALLPHDLGERTSGLASLGVFARQQSLSDSGAPNDVDSDVFTSYRDDHPYGLRLGYSVTHRPWLDTELSAGLSYVTNESFSPADPESLSLAVGVRQLAGPVVVEAGYRRTEYFDDADRAGGLATDLVDLSAEWERWTDRGRLSLGARIGWRIDREEAVGLLSVTWHFGAARGYDDFRPGETPFRDLRELRRFERIEAR